MMNPRTRYQIGSVILGIAVILLVVQFLGMAGMIPKWAPSRTMSLFILILVIGAATIRRSARAAMSSGKQTPRP